MRQLLGITIPHPILGIVFVDSLQLLTTGLGTKPRCAAVQQAVGY
jgi:hypothetical protein